MQKPTFAFEIDPVELSLRIAEEAIGLRRPPDSDNAKTWAALEAEAPVEAATFMRMARRAAEYIAECVSAPGIHAKVQ